MLVPAALAEEPFRDLTFDDACKAAKKDAKFILLDFYTTWCPPCKKLDATTWKDAKVQAWLKDKAIALKVNAEKSFKLTSQYKIMAYPTIVVLQPDGAELRRIVGYLDAEQFLIVAKDLSLSTGAAKPASTSAAPRQNDPTSRMRAAESLAQQGKQKEALDEFLWCFDHGKEADATYHSARLTILLNDISQLGRSYPPAIKALADRRDATRELLLKFKGSFDAASDFASLTRQLGDRSGLLAVYDTLRRQGDAGGEARAVLLDDVLDQLIFARRYKDIIDDARDISDRIERTLQMSASTTERAKKDAYMKSAAEYVKQQAIQEGGNYYEALLGAGKKDEAAKLADRLIEFDNTGRTYAVLVQRSRRAGATEAADAVMTRGRKSLPASEQPALEKASSVGAQGH